MNATDPAFSSMPNLHINASEIAAELQPFPGMTIRTYIAVKAMAGLCSNPGGPFQANAMNGWNLCNCKVEDVARTAIELADALIAELNRTTP